MVELFEEVVQSVPDWDSTLEDVECDSERSEDGLYYLEFEEHSISRSAADVLTATVSNPSGVGEVLKSEYPDVYGMVLSSYEWPEYFMVDWNSMERGEEGQAIQYRGILQVAHMLSVECESISSDAGEMVSAYYGLVSRNGEDLGVEVCNLSSPVRDVPAYYVEGKVNSLSLESVGSDRKVAKNAMEW